ncbi:hypothetical protein ABII15_28315 [Streptomyces sp. HUAS MG91]|uniref:PPE family domain-containing protein n=1 Tax=Streptomyces tabacisoli TaxID=3156398 RepID=A0AAU8J046_9ACTN
MSDKDADYTYNAPTQCYVGKHTSDFKNYNMDQMKAMVQGASPGGVREVSEGWKAIRDQLVETKTVYEAAVAEVLQDWEGTSADQFQARSKVISKKIQDTSTFAENLSTTMANAAVVLERIKPEVMAMEKPGTGSSLWDKATDGGRDEEGLNRDISNKGVSAQEIVDNREGDMSAGREAQMKMAVKMEELGAAYNGQSQSIGTWSKRQHDDGEDYPGEPGGIAPVPIVAGSVTSPSSRSAASNLSRSTGSGSPIAGAQSPNASTDGISGGIGSQKPGTGSQIGAGNLSFGGSGAGAGAVGSGVGAGGGISGGIVGTGAGAGTGGIGGAAIGGGIGAGAGLGAGAAGRGAGAGGRGTGGVGRGGLGAGGSGSGAAGKPGAKGVKGESLARTKGGAIGKSVVKPGSGQQGGSALRQKPKTATGGTGTNAGRNGMAGRGTQANGKDKKRRDNSRPDYLVEDEQTWANDRVVNPKVVE